MNKKYIISGVMTAQLLLTVGGAYYFTDTLSRKNAEISDDKKTIVKLKDENTDKNNRINEIQLKLDELDKQFQESEKTRSEQIKQIEQQNSQIQEYQSKVSQLEKELNFKKKQKGSDVKGKTQNQKVQQVSMKQEGRTITVEATAYTNHPSENGTYGGKVLTRTGYDISNTITYNGMGIIATDPSVIPLNSIVQIEGLGTYICLDTGSAIKGNRIDILVGSSGEASNWGRRSVNVTILE